jgi:hypothetical protein
MKTKRRRRPFLMLAWVESPVPTEAERKQAERICPSKDDLAAGIRPGFTGERDKKADTTTLLHWYESQSSPKQNPRRTASGAHKEYLQTLKALVRDEGLVGDLARSAAASALYSTRQIRRPATAPWQQQQQQQRQQHGTVHPPTTQPPRRRPTSAVGRRNSHEVNHVKRNLNVAANVESLKLASPRRQPPQNPSTWKLSRFEHMASRVVKEEPAARL